MSKYIETYKALSQPPKWALRQIQAGRLKGKTDINPQWRYQAMTEQFGPCGIGWKYEIKRLWNEPGPEGQIFAFAEIDLRIRNPLADGWEWSDPIPGIGGHMLIPKEKSGLHANDEAYKMATTDALSTAMKMLGVAADIYSGAWDGSKYRDHENGRKQPEQQPKTQPELQPEVQAESQSITNTPDEMSLTEVQTEIKRIVREVDKDGMAQALHNAGFSSWPTGRSALVKILTQYYKNQEQRAA